MIEIYNEKVRDLLSAGGALPKGLQVREDAKRGVFYGNFAGFVVFKCWHQSAVLFTNTLKTVVHKHLHNDL